MQNPTINGVKSDVARLHAELTNATGYTTAECTAYIAGTSDDRVTECAVTINLRAGYSSTDHLFDRLAAKVIGKVHGKLFTSKTALIRAAYRVRAAECGYAVEVDETRTVALPEHLTADMQTISDDRASRNAAVRLRVAREKFAKSDLVIVPHEGACIILDRANPYREGEWVYGIKLNPQRGNQYFGYQYPPVKFATEHDAAAAIDVYRASLA